MRLFLLLLLLPFTAFASEITLKEKLREAPVGSFLVAEQSRNFTFIRIFEKKENQITLEEVMIPGEAFCRLKMGWKEWFERGAFGNTSWTLSRIDLLSGNIDEIYSVTHRGWMMHQQCDDFITQLLNLTFQPLADHERRHVGLPPGYGKPDHRPLWNPRLIVGGQIVPKIPFTVWKARWPSDGSELARKVIEVYLPEIVEGAPSYPTFFPYWLEVEGKIGSAKVRVVDSGMESRSCQTHFPTRQVTLLDQGKWEESALVFEIDNPSHLESFFVMAEESKTLFSKPLPLPATIEHLGEVTKLRIPKESLEKELIKGEGYHFLISPEGQPLIETKKEWTFPCM